MRRIVTLSFFILLVLIGLGGTLASALPGARARQQPTAVPLDLPSLTLTPEGGVTATPTPTPTQPGLAYAEAIDEANVRSGPSTDFSKLGAIYSGDQHVVLGIHRDYPWVKIQFVESSTNTAWVYRDLVELSGNTDVIPIIEPEELPTPNPLLIAQQQTLEVLTLTPGAVGTATAVARLFPTGAATAGPTLTHLPTFTPPPLGTYQPGYQNPIAYNSDDDGLLGLPPALPIIGLAVLGLLGLLVSVLRRLF